MKKMICCLAVFLLGLSCQLVFCSQSAAQIQNITITRTVETTDQSRIGLTRLHLERTQSTEIIRNRMDLKFMVQELLAKARSYLQNFKSQTYDKLAQTRNTRENAQNARELAQQMLERQKMLRESQEARLKDMQARAKQLSSLRSSQSGK